MSATIAIIGLAHCLPIVGVGAITKRRPAVFAVTLAMVVIAFAFGGIQYVAADLAGVLIGFFLGYLSSEAPHQHESTIHTPSAATSNHNSALLSSAAASEKHSVDRENPRNIPIHSISDAANVFVSSFNQAREKAIEDQRARTKEKLRLLVELELKNRGLTFASDEMRDDFIRKSEAQIMAEISKSKK